MKDLMSDSEMSDSNLKKDHYGRRIIMSDSESEEPNNVIPQVSEPTVTKDIDLKSVVKLFVTRAQVSYKLPWQRKAPENVTGSGFLIEGRLVVTNVHVVQDSTTILVRRHGSSRKYAAQVQCLGHQADVALLRVESERFWSEWKPLGLSDKIPELRARVLCVGFPTGGAALSLTAGVVSRVDVHHNSNRHTSLLTVQIDAAINSGNSGGPVVNRDGEVIGVAFSHRTSAQNIGYIIPVPVVQHVLDDYAMHGRSLGFCADPGYKAQPMENAVLRRAHGMGEDVTGVRVRSPALLSPFYGHLLDGDVLLELDGEPIGDDDTIAFRADERIKSTHILTRRHVGECVSATVLRNAVRVEIPAVELRPLAHLVPRLHNFDCVPSYYIVAGLVFMPLTGPLLAQHFGKDWRRDAPPSLLVHYHYGNPSDPSHRVVLLTHLLASEITIGYKAGTYFTQLAAFNSRPVNNLFELASAVEAARNSHDLLAFDIGSSAPQRFLLDPQEVNQHSQSILETHHISKPYCPAIEKYLSAEKNVDSEKNVDNLSEK